LLDLVVGDKSRDKILELLMGKNYQQQVWRNIVDNKRSWNPIKRALSVAQKYVLFQGLKIPKAELSLLENVSQC